MKRNLLRGAGGVVVTAGLMVSVGLSGTAAASGAPATTTLSGAVLPGISSLTPTGPVAATTPTNLTIALTGNNAGLDDAYRAIYTPGSASYHHFLTTNQVADNFGASPAQWAAARAWVTGGGLSITYASPDRDVLGVSGPASAVESLLGVQLDNYRNGQVSFYANTGAPTVPSSLGIGAILGLNSLERAVPSGAATATSTTAGTLSALGGLVAGATSENIGTQTPQELWGAYDQPSSERGGGQTIASFGNGSTAGVISDLSTFEKDYGLPHVPVTVKDVGSGPFTDTSGLAEWDLDTQAEVGMAPGISSLSLYFSSTLSDAGIAQAFSAWQSDPNGPLQADASFGECETDPLTTNLAAVLNALNGVLASAQVGLEFPNGLETVAEPILEKATLEGRTLFSSTGDTGSSCPAVVLPVIGAGNGLINQVVPLTEYPASSPYAVAVGGTTLYTNGSGASASRAQESAWSFGGGGDTLLIPQPSYQKGVSNIDLPCLSTATGGTGDTGQPCRGIPDVSAMSGDALTNNYAMVEDGASTAGAGTSLSSPLWVGMWTRVQAAAATAGGNGFANETFYRLGKNPTTYARDFNDITTGVLGVPMAGNGLYASGPGWDYATGWGSPKVANMITDVDG